MPSRKVLGALVLTVGVAFFVFKAHLSTPSERKDLRKTSKATKESAFDARTFSSVEESFAKSERVGETIPTNISEHRRAFSSVRKMIFFVGYPRSCSTLLSSFLDAHPHVVIANEYNFFNVWPKVSDKARRTNRDVMFEELLTNSMLAITQKGIRREREGVEEGELVYLVPNEWNGRYNRTITIIGDKHASTTRALVQKGAENFMKELRKTVHVPIHFLHIIRNPYDNIATIAIRSLGGRNFLLQGNVLNDTKLIDSKIDYYFNMVDRTNQIRAKETVIDIHSIDLLQKPKETLLWLCKKIGITCSEKYLQDCASIVFKQPSQSRKNVQWSDKLIKKVKEKMKPYTFLNQYDFKSN